MPAPETRDTDGAVAFEDCQNRRRFHRTLICRCEPVCIMCGLRKHTAIHGPFYGQPAGSEPYGHRYRGQQYTRLTSAHQVQCRASDQIRGIGCGLPSRLYSTRYLMPVRVFADDSGSGGDSPYYVLGGFLADYPTWERFSDEWAGFLKTQPTLGYFKMSEAESLKGQFLGWSAKQRDEKINGLIDIILKHDPFQASCAIAETDYADLVKPALAGRWGGQYDDPYLFLFMSIIGSFTSTENRWEHAIRGVPKDQIVMFGADGHSGGPPQPIDFVFDEETKKHKKHSRALYKESLMKIPSYESKLGSVDFRDDKQFMPLQAADLAAWLRRRRLCTNEPERDHNKRLHSHQTRSRHSTISRSEIQEVLQALADGLKRASGR